MSTAPYIPRQGSAAFKVIEFFAQNPDKTLDADLIAAKCDCVRASVHTLMRDAVAAGYLERREDLGSGDLVYGKGSVPLPTEKGFHGWLQAKGLQSAEGRPTKANKPAEGIPPPDAPKTPRRSPGKAFFMDLSEVVITSGIPLPGQRSARMDWTPILDRLAVGDSFELPSEARSSVSSAATKFKQATGRKLTLRVVPNGIRVWRVE